MADPINLNKARKAKAKLEDELRAQANRARFGRTKAEKQATRQELERSEREHQGKRLQPPVDPEKDGQDPPA